MNTTWTREPLAVLILVLAAHRLTRLALLDTVWPVAELRTALVARKPGGRMAELLSCPWCLGWWTSAAVVLAACLLPRAVWQPVAVALAGSTVTALLFGLEG